MVEQDKIIKTINTLKDLSNSFIELNAEKEAIKNLLSKKVSFPVTQSELRIIIEGRMYYHDFDFSTFECDLVGESGAVGFDGEKIIFRVRPYGISENVEDKIFNLSDLKVRDIFTLMCNHDVLYKLLSKIEWKTDELSKMLEQLNSL